MLIHAPKLMINISNRFKSFVHALGFININNEYVKSVTIIISQNVQVKTLFQLLFNDF